MGFIFNYVLQSRDTEPKNEIKTNGTSVTGEMLYPSFHFQMNSQIRNIGIILACQASVIQKFLSHCYP